MSPTNDKLRVTFDRQLYGATYRQNAGLIAPRDGAQPAIRGVILELKFTERFPAWMRDLVQIFNLQRISVPKYVECIDAIGLYRLNGKSISRAHELPREVLP